jgi:hypothetical protein
VLILRQVRAILMNASQLASYDYFKRVLLGIKGTQDGPALQFGASFLAGTVATSTYDEFSGFRAGLILSA